MSSSRSTGCGSWPAKARSARSRRPITPFMGATDPLLMEPHARELAGRLKQDAVDAVILPPV